MKSFCITLSFIFLVIIITDQAEAQYADQQETNAFQTKADFTSSNLPIIIIDTENGAAIKNEPKIKAEMKIIYHGEGKRNSVSDSGNVYTGKIGIEIRGAYSASLPQKPYGIETRDISGNKYNVSLLGMPPENDWVLLANYNDKTFSRNLLAFDIFHKMGNYSTRMRFCEVIVNKEYMGIYQFGEKIKQDNGRVDIAKLKTTDNFGDDVTGGYIIKNDYFSATDSWKSNFSPVNKPGAEVYFVYHDPKPEDLSEQQKTYIRGFINTLEMVLYNPSFKAPVLVINHISTLNHLQIISSWERSQEMSIPIKRAGIISRTKTAKMVYCIQVLHGILTGPGETFLKTAFILIKLMVPAGHTK